MGYGKKLRRPGKGTLAERLLLLLESRHPAGVPAGEAAEKLYGTDTLETRLRLRNVVRTLRGWGYRAHGFQGILHLCNGDPKKLGEVAFRSKKVTGGMLRSLADLKVAVNEAGDANVAEAIRIQVLEMLRQFLKEF